MKNHLTYFPAKLFFAIILTNLPITAFALPFTISPKAGTSLPTTVTQGSSTTAYYTVANNTVSTRNNNYVKYLPPNVSQVTNGGAGTCGATFNLAAKSNAGDSCTLQLTITGAVNANDPDPHHHLFVCFPGGTSCAGPTVPLNVTVTPPTPPPSQQLRVTVGRRQNDPIGYISTDNGNTWSDSMFQTSSIGFLDYFGGVACNSTQQSCVSVGEGGGTFSGFYSNPVGFFSRDGGRTWQPATFPTRLFNTNPRSVTCSSNGQNCVLMAQNNDTRLPNNALCYTSSDGGENWTLQALLPLIPSLFGDNPVVVACNSTAQNCTAPGNYYNGGAFVPLSYVTTNGGVSWTFSNTMPPAFPGANDNELNGISCSTNGLKCTVVGSYRIGVDKPLTYTTSDGGNNWAFSSSLPTYQGSGSSILYGVACNTTGQKCVAVGMYTDGGISKPISYTSTNGGNSWTLSNALPTVNGLNHQLRSVTCNSTDQYCTAVGFYNDGVNLPLTYTSSDGGVHWALSTQLPQPVGPSNNELYSIAGATSSSNSFLY